MDRETPKGSARIASPRAAKKHSRTHKLRFDTLEDRVVPANVWISSITSAMEGGTASFVVEHDGTLGAPISFNFSLGGAAVNGTDYSSISTSVAFGPFTRIATITIDTTGSTYNDPIFEGLEDVTLTLTGATGATVVAPSAATLTITDDEIGPAVAPITRASYGSSLLQSAPGTPSNVVLPAGSNDGEGINQVLPALPGDDYGAIVRAIEPATPVLWNGMISITTCPPFAALTYTSIPGTAGTDRGNNQQAAAQMRIQESATQVALVTDQSAVQFFDGAGPTFTNRHGAPEALTESTGNKEYTLIDSTGQIFIFHNYDGTIPTAARGYLKSVLDPYGNTILSLSYNGSGQITSMASSTTTGAVTTTSTTSFAYYSGGTHSGKVQTATLTETVGAGSPVTVRTADYDYYGSSDPNGNPGDLKTLVIKDGSANTLDTQYFRYWTSTGSGGYQGGLRFSITGDAYQRYAAWCAANSTTVTTASNAQLAPFGDLYIEYDSQFRVTRMDVQGAGCSVCSGGVGTYTYSYATSTFPFGYNSWHTKRTEGLPNGSTRVMYYNYVGEPMLMVHQENSQEWVTFFEYDAAGRLAMVAAPSAVSGYDATKADLVNDQSGDYQYIRNSLGFIATLSYGASTTATSSTPGDVAGYLESVAIQRGETGTSIPQGVTNYLEKTGGGRTVYPISDTTIYTNTNGTGGKTTSYTWSWFNTKAFPDKLTVTLPIVTTGQNGSNSATTYTVIADTYGRTQWVKDQAGFISYMEHDDATGAVTKAIQDVDTAQSGTFSNLPSGWTTPGGGGLHLTTTYVVDNLGRPTESTDPNGNVTYTVYRDDIFESRVYSAWNTGTNAPTGPTIVYREDRARGYRETITMSATPSLTSAKPNGTESIANIESLTREILNAAGQVVAVDRYFDWTGVTYSASSVTLGTSGTNYHRTEYAYDQNGMLNRTLTPTGTIYRTFRDGQGRTISTWIGTDDTPSIGSWSPSNLTGTDMVQTSLNEFDGGGVGDGNLTTSAVILGSPYANRETDHSYDWRNRPIASKVGVEGSESTSLNRPIYYTEYDNLGQAIVSEMYDGDTLSITTDSGGDGVPDRPTSSALRAKSTADFDELGRVYESETFSVDPSSGSVSSNSLKSQSWFDSRGNLIKSASPGGIVSKQTVDGASRSVSSFLTDGGGDSVYSNADDVTSDNVPSQTDYTYDANGNVIFTVSKERFHDETGTGALGTPSSGVKARVYYNASYFDKANRLTDSVNAGTNGGSAYSRPGSPDSRSDTKLVTSYGYNTSGRLESVTDPKGLINKTYYDLAGRTSKTIENYVNGVVSDADDKTVDYTYHANDQMKTLKAYLTSSTFETTEWVLGITTPMVSNDVLKEMKYPDTSTGASSSEKDQYTYFRDGQIATFTDRNGNVHTYSYDILGRMTADVVSTLGSGVDGAVRRIEYEYNTQGKLYLITSYDATSSGSIVNQIQREFDGLGNLITEWQATNGAVNTGSSPKVQYAWSFAPSGSNNHNRLTSITYPNGRVIDYVYTTGLDADISRLSQIKDGATVLESYIYLGYGTVVKRGHANGVDLDYMTPIPGVADYTDAGDGANNPAAGDEAWIDPDHVAGSDTDVASVALLVDQYSEYLEATDFGFAIPNDAEIVGVVVGIERSSDNGSIFDSTVSLLSEGSAVGSDGSSGINWSIGFNTERFGSDTDDWGAGLTGADVNDDSFGVRVQARARGADDIAYVDNIQVKISYLDPTGEAGDQYTGLDRFGRVIDQNWTTSAGVEKDRRQYGYDRNSNRLYAKNTVDATRSELYAYDGFNQLTSMDRGTLNGGNTAISGSPSRSQDWDYDGLGNWDSVTNNGGSPETRTHNKQNEITGISGASTPTYDANGSMLSDETGKQFVYDAWNRLKIVKNSGGTTLATYSYDATGRRVRETRSGTTTDLYYSDQWQVLEERVSGTPRISYVWSPVYVDAMIARDRDSDSNGSLEERLYAIHDANFNVVALADTSGNVQERYAYDAFGVFSVLTPAWGARGSSSYAWKYLHQDGRWDADGALYSFRHREYSPTLGRWLQVDPIGFEGGNENLYVALSNSPKQLLDPNGTQEAPYRPPSLNPGTFKKAGKRGLWGVLAAECIILREAVIDLAEAINEYNEAARRAEELNRLRPDPMPKPEPKRVPPPDRPKEPKPEPKNCATSWRYMANCTALEEENYNHKDMQSARRAFTNKGWIDPQFGNGGDTETGVAQHYGGKHINVNAFSNKSDKKRKHAGSVQWCACCRDTPQGPDPTVVLYRANVKNKY